jgi:hypothetical protein
MANGAELRNTIAQSFSAASSQIFDGLAAKAAAMVRSGKAAQRIAASTAI